MILKSVPAFYKGFYQPIFFLFFHFESFLITFDWLDRIPFLIEETSYFIV